jgi:hypothetical protein
MKKALLADDAWNIGTKNSHEPHNGEIMRAAMSCAARRSHPPQ